MSVLDCARSIIKYVGDPETAAVLVAIAGAESGYGASTIGDCGYSGPFPPCNGCCSWGPWQINICWHSNWIGAHIGNYDPCTIANWLQNFDNSAWAAVQVMMYHGGLNAWTTYRNGAYARFLDEARSAVQQALSEAGGGQQESGGEVVIPSLAPAVALTLISALAGVPMVVYYYKPEAITGMYQKIKGFFKEMV